MGKSRIWQTVADGEILYLPHFIAKDEADLLLSQLQDQVAWQQRSIFLFGKSIPQPRLTAWYSDKSYRYSGLTLNPTPMPSTIIELQRRCESACQHTFNSVLLNLYRDGKDSMGWHQDNEIELGVNPIIASLSLGATRTFALKHIHSGDSIRFELSHGALLVMGGTLQHYWKHALPKSKRILSPRINLTFRNINELE
ncbi:hypothetical protein VII00023_10579 [Vibrio ichthyoenteri ATCC 700023]|uniref:Fe2OG dioxygenase domain-containing protein n=1 Tax=Vibrio ichthyoenteri ATCC 700023 TaxID=870968 RepID=F9S310_9VIBR|nr:alpha-ketoglutarate-dependent dioxygenase AlkB [Vibrio ichthyoenteri]EGU38569.1 hypothetical protein VII00023_10579 [Vibrio ichthyoenteri ATCC 700023]